MNLNLKKIHILVVEDIQPMRELMIELLNNLGVGQVSATSDGEAGYEAYLRKKPDIIMADWNMPKLTGLELVQRIRKDKSSPNRVIPFIMVTGFCAKDRIQLARDNGVTELLIKPFSANDVALRIAHIIKNPRDFIICPDFVGPDRRRKEDENFSGDHERTREPPKMIKPNHDLRVKAGIGPVDPKAVKKSQKALEDNKIDFVPLAHEFLAELLTAVNVAKTRATPTRRDVEDIIYPVMQIKANARIFKYELVGNLANIMLNFLENLNEIDEYALEIIAAHQKTVTHILDNRKEGNGGEVGQNLEEELENACKRYRNAKIKLQKKKFESIVDEE